MRESTSSLSLGRRHRRHRLQSRCTLDAPPAGPVASRSCMARAHVHSGFYPSLACTRAGHLKRRHAPPPASNGLAAPARAVQAARARARARAARTKRAHASQTRAWACTQAGVRAACRLPTWTSNELPVPWHPPRAAALVAQSQAPLMESKGRSSKRSLAGCAHCSGRCDGKPRAVSSGAWPASYQPVWAAQAAQAAQAAWGAEPSQLRRASHYCS